MQKRILVIGQAVHPTGYARVLHSVLQRLQSSYKIHHFGINYKGAPREQGWTIHPNRVLGDILGVEQLPQLLATIQPDLVFFLHDLYLYEAHKRTLDRYWPDLKIVVYCPIDGTSADPKLFACLDRLDRLVLFTDWAQDVVATAFDAVRVADAGFTPPSIAVIQHGVDTTIFRPLVKIAGRPDIDRSRYLARQILFPEHPELLDAFIVLNANRNQPRKRIDLTLAGFAEFAQDKPANVKLYLHMGMRDHGCDVLALAHEYGIADRLLLTTRDETMPHASDAMLNLIYNACDIGLNTATGEGWGLVAFEHAATGAAQLLPRHSACADLWHDVAAFVEPRSAYRYAFDCVEHQVVAGEDVAAVLDQLYRDPCALREYSARAYAHATAPAFDWNTIAAQWDAVFRDVLARDHLVRSDR